MKGTSHVIIGAATGFIVASYSQANPETTIALVGIGGFSGLVPDLDIGGKLRSKLTKPHASIRHTAQLIGLLLMVYSFLIKNDTHPYFGMGIGAVIFVLASMFKQKHMLMITGIGVLAGGYFLEENWVLLFGTYILMASLTPHRSYTHSLIGLVFFGIIGYQFEQSLVMEGVFYTCLLGYVSHLVADSKLVPFNKRGVPLFLPFTKTEI
ncbi:MAG TPA: metal-dependent hydrolase [Virgibacillus sp.]|nr:metal-dependent hydrolase [Virgibacillus sp.]